jgi:hypothetical protein
MNNTYDLELTQQGLTIPLDLLELFGFNQAEIVRTRVTPQGIMLMPITSVVSDVAKELYSDLQTRGETIEDLLANGERIREQIFKEKYGELISD